MLALKRTVAGILVILALSGGCYGLYQKLETTELKLIQMTSQKASVDAALESSTKTIVSLNERIKDAKKASQEFSEVNRSLNNKYISLEKEYKEYLGRDHIIQKKPTLVNRKMNRSFNKFVDEVSCNSGVESSCTKD